MRYLSETTALASLGEIRESLRASVSEAEKKAKDCLSCESRGICCTDVHFVNVRITRLEALAISKAIDSLPKEKRDSVRELTAGAAEILEQKASQDFQTEFYSCPLFDKELGCTVHEVKPGACIHHACYERAEDLPEESLLTRYEEEVGNLCKRAYGVDGMPKAIPLALTRIWRHGSGAMNSTTDQGER